MKSLVRYEYITPLLRVTPNDLNGTPLERCSILHFMSLPSRAASALEEIRQMKGWKPVTVYEPVPVCVQNLSLSLTHFLRSILAYQRNYQILLLYCLAYRYLGS
jgi:hypothetical protein